MLRFADTAMRLAERGVYQVQHSQRRLAAGFDPGSEVLEKFVL
jgi:hypothetical protein